MSDYRTLDDDPVYMGTVCPDCGGKKSSGTYRCWKCAGQHYVRPTPEAFAAQRRRRAFLICNCYPSTSHYPY